MRLTGSVFSMRRLRYWSAAFTQGTRLLRTYSGATTWALWYEYCISSNKSSLCSQLNAVTLVWSHASSGSAAITIKTMAKQMNDFSHQKPYSAFTLKQAEALHIFMLWHIRQIDIKTIGRSFSPYILLWTTCGGQRERNPIFYKVSTALRCEEHSVVPLTW